MELNFDKLSKVSNRNIIDIALKVAFITEPELMEKIKKIKPTSISVQDRIFLETLIKDNKKIVLKL